MGVGDDGDNVVEGGRRECRKKMKSVEDGVGGDGINQRDRKKGML